MTPATGREMADRQVVDKIVAARQSTGQVAEEMEAELGSKLLRDKKQNGRLLVQAASTLQY